MLGVKGIEVVYKEREDGREIEGVGTYGTIDKNHPTYDSDDLETMIGWVETLVENPNCFKIKVKLYYKVFDISEPYDPANYPYVELEGEDFLAMMKMEHWSQLDLRRFAKCDVGVGILTS